MADRRKEKNKNIKLGFFVFIFVVVVIAWGVIRFNPAVTTQTVYHGEVKETVNAKGIAVFEEELIASKNNGVAILNYSDGTRVTSKTHVATIYSGKVDEGKSLQISELNEKINYLEMNLKNHQENKNTSESLNTLLIGKMKDISYDSHYGNMESIKRTNAEIESIITTNNTVDVKSRLEAMKAQRDDVERTITGNKEAYISKSAGIIYGSLDGYETTILPKTVEKINSENFKNLWNGKPVDYESNSDKHIYGKIVNNYEITVVSLVATKDIEGMEVGDTVYIQMSHKGADLISATIKSISTSKKDSVVTLSVLRDTHDFIAERKFEFKFVKNSFKGLKVPKEAIFEENNKSCVWVIKDSVVRKKNVEIIYKDNECVMVKEDNSNDNGLLLYDLIIVKSKNISEGMIVSDYNQN